MSACRREFLPLVALDLAVSPRADTLYVKELDTVLLHTLVLGGQLLVAYALNQVAFVDFQILLRLF